ncbi:hypothetical protein MP638_006069 [Amoeboaphelidium occidentale]|nr:hypothetical protein MP638_006069 [Amoeboaphelidium occidentale]
MAQRSNGNDFKDFTYGLSCDVNQKLRVKVCRIRGRIPEQFKEDSDGCFEWSAQVSLWADNKILCMEERTRFRNMDNSLEFNEILSFPMSVNELPLSAQLVITIYADAKTVVGGTTLKLFHVNGILRSGLYRLFLHIGKDADARDTSSTSFRDPETQNVDSKLNEVRDRLLKLEASEKKYERGEVVKISWLDDKTFAEVEKAKAEFFDETHELYLYFELPRYEFPVIFKEKPYEITIPSVPYLTNKVVKIYDPDMFHENLVEAKHRRIIRSHRTGYLDKELKPNAKNRDDLLAICAYPPTKKLTNEEADLVWKYRFYLTKNKQALTKFLKSVYWSEASERKHATEVLLKLWTDIRVDDALELLGPDFKDKRVREYAVRQLEKAEDEDLQLYLLQLVQAIKFEELDDKAAFQSPLVDFLTNKSIKNPVLGNYFYWYLMSEFDDQENKKLYGKVAYHFMKRMEESQHEGGQARREILRRQAEIIETLAQVTKSIRQSKDSRPKKIEKLQNFISDPKHRLNQFQPIPLPLDPSISVTGISAEKASVFKSNMFPLKLYFKTVSGIDYPLIFKHGDDLRQDQLIMQVIMLMDKLLRKENLDLKLTPFKVLATGNQCGMIQYVPSSTLAFIIAKYNSNIQAYLRDVAYDAEATDTFQIRKAVFDAYIKSCAGYCVITYLLGIGDRHLDNLLVSPEGHLFHVDFGYILGRDPKPFPPPMKLCKEMVDCMGGTSSHHFAEFRSLTHTAFLILRRNANLILNLFTLMVKASIPDIQLEPDKCVLKVQEKFRLDISEEEAIVYFDKLMTDSLNALFPQLMETVHKWAQYWRK